VKDGSTPREIARLQPIATVDQQAQRAIAVHPACDLFPMMNADELKPLTDSIKKTGGLLTGFERVH
jgi:hypothetical protein